MADEKLNLEKFHGDIEVGRTSDYKTIYVNSTRMGVSPWDVRMTLGQVVERPEGKQINEDQVTIVMSPGQAKAFLVNLATTIAKYEEAFGEINDPTGLLKKAKSAPHAPKPKLKKID